MHEPDCCGSSLGPQRSDEVACRRGVGKKQFVEGESAEVVGAGGEMHDGIKVAHRTHGFMHSVRVGEIADSSVQARMTADRHDIVTASPQRHHDRRTEIPRSTRDENPHACPTD